jgi:hypothetical protein
MFVRALFAFLLLPGFAAILAPPLIASLKMNNVTAFLRNQKPNRQPGIFSGCLLRFVICI